MADWADDRAARMKVDSGFYCNLFADQQKAVAQALRDVQRETAEECCKIAHGQHAWHDTLEDAIRERFGLDEKRD